MYIIDMNSKLELTALMIPRPGTLPVPLVRTSYLLDACPWSHALCPLFPDSGNSLVFSRGEHSLTMPTETVFPQPASRARADAGLLRAVSAPRSLPF